MKPVHSHNFQNGTADVYRNPSGTFSIYWGAEGDLADEVPEVFQSLPGALAYLARVFPPHLGVYWADDGYTHDSPASPRPDDKAE